MTDWQYFELFWWIVIITLILSDFIGDIIDKWKS